MDTTAVQIIASNCIDGLYHNKLKNLGEIKFLDTYELLKLKQEAVKTMNCPRTASEIVKVIKTLPPKKSPGPYRDSVLNSVQNFRALQYSSNSVERERALPNSFLEASINLIPKQDSGYENKTKQNNQKTKQKKD